jgi:urease gamma subunit
MNTTSPGRPKKFDPGDEEIEYIKRLASVLNQEQIAGVFGVSGETLRRRKKEDPRIEVAIQQGKAEAVATVGTALLKKARDGDTISQIFYLKAQGGWRDRHDVVHSGKIEHEVDFPKLREDLGRMLGDMADRRVKAKLLKPTMFANENEDEEPGKPFEVIEGGASDSDDG